jgi:AraC-like DNA-binding protein
VLTTIVPKCAVLQKYIDSFYVFDPKTPINLRYLAFPHINTGLSFFKGGVVNRSNFRVEIIEQQTNEVNYCIEILGKYTQPVFVHYEGCIDEIAIIFKPLGINRFIGEDLLKVAPEYSQAFENKAWQNIAPKLFDAEDRIACLEGFLLSIISEKQDYGKIEDALALFEHQETDYSVADVARQLGLNLKTFQRNFTKAMGCSPSDYKRISRFRNSLRSKLLSPELKSLTNISYENNYSDQSYFIREFRKLTGQNPGLFFREICLMDGEKIVWEIL